MLGSFIIDDLEPTEFAGRLDMGCEGKLGIAQRFRLIGVTESPVLEL